MCNLYNKSNNGLLPILGNFREISFTALIFSGLSVDAGEPVPPVDIRHRDHRGQHVSLHFPAEEHGQEDQR